MRAMLKKGKLCDRAHHIVHLLLQHSQGDSSEGTVKCGNARCYEIQMDAAFKRCSACRAVAYCSKACQMTDWKSGGHKRHCKGTA
jgi:hypothetical protein